MTKVDLPNLYQTVVGMLLIINFNNSSTSISLKLPSSHTRVTSIKFTKQEWVSQSVSQLVSDKQSQWSDSGPIKMVGWLNFPCPWYVIWSYLLFDNIYLFFISHEHSSWQPEMWNVAYSIQMKSKKKLLLHQILKSNFWRVAVNEWYFFQIVRAYCFPTFLSLP